MMGRTVDKKIKKGYVIAISAILLLCIVLGGYLMIRRTHLCDDDLLLTYESREPVEIIEETVDDISYTEYLFGEDIGRVTVTGEGRNILIRDDRNGFIKEYRYHVLYCSYDFQRDELFAGILSYIKPAYWLKGSRKVTTRYGGYKRTDEECREIGQWLADGERGRITENRRNEIVVTDSGTYFVN